MHWISLDFRSGHAVAKVLTTGTLCFAGTSPRLKSQDPFPSAGGWDSSYSPPKMAWGTSWSSTCSMQERAAIYTCACLANKLTCIWTHFLWVSDSPGGSDAVHNHAVKSRKNSITTYDNLQINAGRLMLNKGIKSMRWKRNCKRQRICWWEKEVELRRKQRFTAIYLLFKSWE